MENCFPSSYLFLFIANNQLEFPRNKSDLQPVMEDLCCQYERCGLQINFNKTEYLAIGSDTSDLRLENRVCKGVQVSGVYSERGSP